MTTVVHCLCDPFDVLVARPTRWGNPFRLRDNRDRVIAKFARYLLGEPTLLSALPELLGLRIACYCAPLRCHGHVLAALVDKRVEETELGDWADWTLAGQPEADLRWDAAFLLCVEREIFNEFPG